MENLSKSFKEMFSRGRESKTEGKRVLMIAGEFCEDLNAWGGFQMLKLLGHQVSCVCPDTKKGQFIHTAVHDFEEGYKTYTEKCGHKFWLNADFKSVIAADFDGLYIVGGRGSEYIRLNQTVVALVKDFNNSNKPIAAIGHGPQLLIAAGMLKGRTLTCYEGISPDVKMAGGIYKPTEHGEAVVDTNLVTGESWWGQENVAREFSNLLGTQIHQVGVSSMPRVVREQQPAAPSSSSVPPSPVTTAAAAPVVDDQNQSSVETRRE
jgi:protease I